MIDTPKGERREVKGVGGVTIGGAPVAYVAVMAAIVVAMAFVPISVRVGGGGNGWPLHDVFHPLVGLILGPIAGPIASIIGILLGNALAPYTAFSPWGSLLGGMSAFAVGMMTQKGQWRWLVPWLITLVLHAIYYVRAIDAGISPGIWLSNSFTVTLALILIAIPPLRRWVVATVQSEKISWRTGVALYILCFFGSTSGIQVLWLRGFLVNPWPEPVWLTLIPVVFYERTVFPLIGALLALGVLVGLRRSSFVKPKLAGY